MKSRPGLFLSTFSHIQRAVLSWPKRRIREWLAWRNRARLDRVCFVGVTGSAGKTTTVRLIHAVASRAGPAGIGGHTNSYSGATQAMTQVRSKHRFWVQEVGAHAPGAIAPTHALLRPHIGVVTAVGGDHRTNYRTLEATALEKGMMVELLPATGLAILNADDPFVRAMAARTKARVVLAGMAEDADVRGTVTAMRFPGTLSVEVAAGGRSVLVTTHLVGRHWVFPILAACAAGLEFGITLEDCAAAIADLHPTIGRYSVHRPPNGAVYVLDSIKAPFWTVAAGLALLADAEATRRTAVFGTISDYSGAAGARYRRIAREALDVADRVLFVGRNADSVSRLAAEYGKHRVKTFQTVAALRAFLAANTSDGELIYVKGSQTADHLERLVLADSVGVACWLTRCGHHRGCEECRHRIWARGTPPSLALGPSL